MTRVHHFQRLRRQNANFSLEFIFEDVRRRLDGKIEAHPVVAPFFSNGVFRRLLITLHAAIKQAEVNHVTGDITFVTLGLDSRRTMLTILDCGNVLESHGLKRILMQRLWLDWPVRRAKLVTTISERARSEILRLTGCPPEKVHVIPVAISDGFVFSPKETMPVEPRILAIGTAPNKNLPRLVEALRGIPCTLVVIGVLTPEVRKLLELHAVRHENLVNLPNEDVVEQYRQCDLVAFASTYEGFGMPILEAQATGRPVITSNRSSMPEVAGEGACLVDPLDVGAIRAGVLRIIQDAGFRERLVELGRVNVRRFEPNAIALRYAALYEQIAAEVADPPTS